ncbi:short chain type dehydrogenase [Abortiporus biennis]|nr:short chain type dehydrogenase [Abortiporus biennis]
MSLPLSGKVAIVTGSSRSIGSAIAKRLARDGANVVINYHSTDSASPSIVANAINGREGGRAIIVKADVSTIEGGKHLLEQCIKQLGVPDILVLNAASMGHRTLGDIDEEYYNHHFDTNVKGPLFMAKAVAEVMPTGGRIIFVSTALTRASTILPMGLILLATKGAVEQIVRVLSKDLGQRGITVNALAPGPFDSPQFRSGKTPQQLAMVAAMHPQKRIPMPEEMTSSVAFLVSDEASWVNGQIFGVNGAFVV